MSCTVSSLKTEKYRESKIERIVPLKEKTALSWVISMLN